jgi:hypothetical protein
MNQHFSVRSTALSRLVAAVLLVSACGGRSITIDEGSGAGNSSGVSAAGAAASSSGASSGGAVNAAGTGGSSSAAGGGDQCGFCTGLVCPPGEELMLAAGECCATCVADCLVQACAGLTCPSGSQAEFAPGQCCPTCVADPLDCPTGQAAYTAERMALLDKYADGCAVDSDCVWVSIANACESGCNSVTILSSQVLNLTANLSNAAALECASCRQSLEPRPPCVPPSEVTCNAGQCEFAPPPPPHL